MQKHYITLAIIGLFACLAQFAIDIYTPSLLAIATQFGVSMDYVQWSITIYAFGLSLSMLINGPLSEAFGRKKPLLCGLLLILVGSLICALSQTITMLIIGRLVQGLGGGGVAVLWRAIMRDLFTGDELAKYLSYLTPIIVGIMAVAPLLGGYFQHYLSWRASFIFLFLYALTCIGLILYQYNESSQHHTIARLKFSFVTTAFWEILSNRVFIGYAACVFLTFGAFFCWFIIGPVIIMHLLKISPIKFGWINSIALLTMTPLGSLLNARLVKRIKSYKMMCYGFLIIILAGLILLISHLFFHLNIYSVLLAVFLLYFGVSFIWINTSSGAMTPFGHIAGYAATLYSFIQYSGGALIGSLLAYIPDHSAMPLAVTWIVIPLIGIAIVKWIVIPATTSCY